MPYVYSGFITLTFQTNTNINMQLSDDKLNLWDTCSLIE